MRVAAVFLYAFLMMPVAVDIRFYTDDHTLIGGAVRLSFYGISLRAPFQVEKHDGVYLQIGRKINFKLQFQANKQRKAPTLQGLKCWSRNLLVFLDLQMGTGDACSTALYCGALQAFFACVPRVVFSIRPQYGSVGYRLQVHCIAVFRLGKLFLTAARMAFRRIAAKSAGGRANGNHPEQANQLRHADGP